MTLKASLKSRPVIYEIVPPRRDSSKFNTELSGVEAVLSDQRIEAINIPELITRRKDKGQVRYSPATIPPEEYALMIKDSKEAIVNLIAPRLPRDELRRRARRMVDDYGIHNMVLVGRERHGDSLPGPEVVEGFRLLGEEVGGRALLGGICIFDRETRGGGAYGRKRRLSEAQRVWTKAEAGCRFVTSQITFDPKAALGFLEAYQESCKMAGTPAVTVFVSLATVGSAKILTLLEKLEVTIPREVRKALTKPGDMGKTSLEICEGVFQEIVAGVEDRGIRVPLGLHVEQVGVNSGELALELLDRVYPLLKQT